MASLIKPLTHSIHKELWMSCSMHVQAITMMQACLMVKKLRTLLVSVQQMTLKTADLPEPTNPDT
jgi:hypothetical protein